MEQNTETTSYRIRRIRVTGGFLDGLDFSFKDGLNCVIGARGTGKTTLLEFIRYALDLVSSEPNARKHFDCFINSNLAGGRVELFVTTLNGTDYIISRTAGEEPMLLNGDGSPSGQPYHKSLFRLDIFSQNEVEATAGNTASQLTLIEAFERDALDSLEADVSAAKRELEGNAEQLDIAWARVAELTDAVAALPSVEEKLKSFVARNEDESSEVARENTLRSMRDREKIYADRLKEVYFEYARKAKTLVGFFREGVGGLSANEFADSPNYGLLKEMQDIFSKCSEDVDALLERIGQCVNASWAQYEPKYKALFAAHQAQDVRFTQLAEKNEANKQVLAERMKLERDHNRLKEQERELNEKRAEYQRLREEQDARLKKLSTLLDSQFRVRQGIINRINGKLMPRIRVSLTQFGDISAYQTLIAEGIRKQMNQYNPPAKKVAEKIPPAELVGYIREGNEAAVQEAAGLTPAQAKAVVVAFRGDEKALVQLQTAKLLDLPVIELNDNGTYKSTERLSTGQKCNAILPILLLDSDRPLIIDQPEDNLDNGCIHDTIVASIQAVKGRRQLVFATHNPNIPVLGDAEAMLVMKSDGSNGSVQKCGNVDDCKKEIIDLLEGGKEAFEQRMTRYKYRNAK